MAVPYLGLRSPSALPTKALREIPRDISFEGLHMARPPRPWYARGAWRTDFGGERNKVLVTGPKNSETKLLAEKALLELREQVKLLHDHPGMNTPIAMLVERFLNDYANRVVHQDYRNELNWFMRADPSIARGAKDVRTAAERIDRLVVGLDSSVRHGRSAELMRNLSRSTWGSTAT
jgi:hypothetical protein